MAAITATLISRDDGLRALDLRRDLGGIAALMELCFGDTLDGAGWGAVREMQRLSRSGPLLWVMGTVAPAWQLGFVWIENGRVIGNASTQPSEHDRRTWLIANVAVHPDYRRRRMARALTEATMRLALDSGATQILLQVNQNNTAARRLYEALGFQALGAHTAWERMTGFRPQPAATSGIEIRPARAAEWEAVFGFVSRYRPEGFSWLKPLRSGDWRPSLARAFDNFFAGAREEHWLAVDQVGKQIVGLAKIDTGFSPSDQIYVLIHPDWASRLERPLLVTALRRLGNRPWGIRIDHPAGAAEIALQDLGFRRLQTLVWMKKQL